MSDNDCIVDLDFAWEYNTVCQGCGWNRELCQCIVGDDLEDDEQSGDSVE